MTDSGKRVEKILVRHPGLGMVILVFQILILVKLITGFSGLLGQDPYAYLEYTEKLLDLYANGNSAGQFHWPVLYPWLGSILAYLFGGAAGALQFISMLALAFSAGLVVSILRLQTSISTRTAMLAGVLVAFAPYLFRSGMMVMAENLCVFFILSMVFCLSKWEKEDQAKWLVLAGFAAVAACMTRYAAAPMIMIPAVWTGFLALRKKKWLAILFTLLIATLPIFPQILLHTTAEAGFSGHPIWSQWTLLNLFRNDFTTTEGNLHYTFPNLIHVFSNWIHPGFLFAGIGIIPFLRKKDISSGFQKVLMSSILLYALFLGGIGHHNNRLLLLSFPLIVLFLGPALERGLTWAAQRKLILISGLGILLLGTIALNVRGMEPLVERSNLEYGIWESLEKEAPHRIYAFELDIAIGGLGSSHTLVNMYNEKLTHGEKGEWVLFNQEKLAKQWAGHNPMLNWEWLNENFTLVVIREFPENWTLYELR